jgi:hypothetical protein
MRGAPELVQFGDLAADHLRRHPVWVAVHTVDGDEPWYDDTDEETFRPWTGNLPVDPSQGMFLVRARLVLADGTAMAGFATPAPVGTPDLGLMQPQLFLPDGSLAGFWYGMQHQNDGARERFYSTLGRRSSQVFPVSFRLEEGLAAGCPGGQIEGFYTVSELGRPPLVIS